MPVGWQIRFANRIWTESYLWKLQKPVLHFKFFENSIRYCLECFKENCWIWTN